MVFSDLFFLFAFIPAFLILYLLGALIDKKCLKATAGEPSCAVRNSVLVVFSLIFYAWGEPMYVFLMLGSVLINFIAGRVIDRQERHRKAALVVGLTVNILILCACKYTGFFAQMLNDIGLPVPIPQIALPIGISFYTFQSISYLVDVYRRESPAQRRYIDLLLYISMFPQLIAGPIVRYDTVAHEINHRRSTTEDVAEGIYRFMLGLGKKVIIANQLSEISTQFLADGFTQLTTAGAWIGIVAFTFQIYFDFSGYSDMAIGIGRCLGFHFKENFDHPYCSQTVTEFWRRWHMSLGSFFRDYVYIPMGGNRRHQWLNIAVVWFLTGMWHGAAWNFILWGCYFGVLLVFEKYIVLKVSRYIPRPLMHIYLLFIVVFGWGLFYFDDMSRYFEFVPALFGGGHEGAAVITNSALLDKFWIWVAAILFSMPMRKWTGQLCRKVLGDGVAGQTVVMTGRLLISFALLVLSVALLVGATNNPFLYTRF